jgi:hypothetical protein
LPRCVTTAHIDSPRRRARPGVALVCIGTVLILLMIAFPGRLRVPAYVGYIAAATFVFAGFLALANVFCGPKLRAWLAVALLSLMVFPSIWIAIGPGPRSCSLQIGPTGGAAGEDLCRGAFGIGSVFGVLMLVLALRYALVGDSDEGFT